MTILNLEKIPYRLKREGLHIKLLTGEKTQLCMIKLDPGLKTDHSHVHEQMGYILSGEVELTIAGQTETLQPGDAYHIPANVGHGFHVSGPQPVEYIEIFNPPKPENG